MTESVLAISDFTSNPGKIERHFGPLADTASITMVCLATDEDLDIDYRTVPATGFRPLDVLLMFAAALVEGWRGEFDAVVSISLIPHGCFALAVGRLYDLPVHLGIIGADMDVHAEARYGPVIRWLFRRFDAISVPGSVYADRLAGFGVTPDRIGILANAIDREVYHPPDEEAADDDDVTSDDATSDDEPAYDYVWVGRFGPEKDPLLFVRALAVLTGRDREFSAAMLGEGPLEDRVDAALEKYGLDERVERPGWVETPATYHRRSGAFVLTSARDALPLTLIEAMATGLPSVVPPVGNVQDVAVDRETALVVEREPRAIADALDRLAEEPMFRDRLGTNAARAARRYTYEAATEDWERLLGILGTRPAGEDETAS